MNNPYEQKVIGQCSGCDGEIYEGQKYRILRDGSKVHHHEDNPECLPMAVGAVTPEEYRENHQPKIDPIFEQIFEDFIPGYRTS